MSLRRIIGAIFILGVLGTSMELVLIAHTEDIWQWVPLLLLPACILLFLLQIVFRKAAMIRVFRIILFLCIVSGFVGIGLHYKAKMEFKLETNPALTGWELISQTIRGATVPPVLAPGMMIQIGLLGWAYTYQHPILQGRSKKKEF
jgi:uncharacterized membrane protein